VRRYQFGVSILYSMEQFIMNHLPKRQEGQGLVEYALILVLVAIVVIVILQLMSSSIILAYARIMGGFNGQHITGVGNEGIAISYGLEETKLGNGGQCQGTFTDIIFVLTEDGQLVTDRTLNINLGGSNVSIDIPRNGLARFDGPVTITAPCPIKPVLNNW
jgi:pilus assembly protein Flp/PilA